MYKDKNKFLEYQRKRRQKRINYLRQIRKNGCCAFCGWKEHPEILNFHYLDPSSKEFGFSGSEIGNVKLEKLQQEIDKCILLCPNCHTWLHFQENAKIAA